MTRTTGVYHLHVQNRIFHRSSKLFGMNTKKNCSQERNFDGCFPRDSKLEHERRVSLSREILLKAHLPLFVVTFLMKISYFSGFFGHNLR